MVTQEDCQRGVAVACWDYESLPHLSLLFIAFKCPPEASEVVQALDQLILQAIQALEPKVAELKKDHVAQLQKLQKKYTKLGKLDEAVAIRDAIRQISQTRPLRSDIQSVPQNLSGHRGEIGAVLYFEVTGSTQGSVWGTDIYTADSRLSAVAVHAGILREGVRGVVKVAILPFARACIAVRCATG